jgi:hypothetical protein
MTWTPAVFVSLAFGLAEPQVADNWMAFPGSSNRALI